MPLSSPLSSRPHSAGRHALNRDSSLAPPLSFRHVFQNCCSILKDLSLHSNLFRHIPHPALRHLGPTLRTLDLGENQITEVHPSALAGLDALDGLRLAGNRIRRLGEAVFEKAAAIKRLNLADNEIEHIDQKTFTPLKRLKVSERVSV